MPAAFAMAAGCLALAWLIAEQGLARSKALRGIVSSPRGLARLLIGALLPGAMAAAVVLLADSRYRIIAVLAGFSIASLICATLLKQHHRAALRTVYPWLCAMLAPLFVTLTCVAHDAQSWLIGGFALAFALALGLPAFHELAQRLDDAHVPAFMRPLPARAMAAGILALAMAGSASW